MHVFISIHEFFCYYVEQYEVVVLILFMSYIIIINYLKYYSSDKQINYTKRKKKLIIKVRVKILNSINI